MTADSAAIWSRAQELIPGGVNSPVRSFRSVGGTPFFVERGEGPYLYDIDGKRYTDYVLSWGPLILGHAHPAVVEAVADQLHRGTSYGAPTVAEVRLAERIARLVPSVEMVRLVNSGTEATMSALRLARAATGRDVVLKFTGCYHGHADAFLVAAGSGVATLGLPNSPGVPEAAASQTAVLPFNDLDAVEDLFGTRGDEISSVFVEPVVGNSGLIPPLDGFLEGLRSITERHGALLVFDEVMTGFRVAMGGAQERYDVMPDLTTLGKVIGGGLPVGAFGGRRDIMERVAPAGSRLPGGYPVREPAGHGGGRGATWVPGDPRPVSGSGNRREPSRAGCRFGPGDGGHPGLGELRGIHVGRLLSRGAGPLLRGRPRCGYRQVPTLPPCLPRAGCVSCTLSVRGRFRIHRPHARGHRRDPRGGPGGGVAGRLITSHRLEGHDMEVRPG